MKPREISLAFQTDKTAHEYIALARLVDKFDFDVISVYCDAPFHPSFGPLDTDGSSFEESENRTRCGLPLQNSPH